MRKFFTRLTNKLKTAFRNNTLMFDEVFTYKNTEIRLMVTKQTAYILNIDCFYGKQDAGIFIRHRSVYDILYNPFIRTSLLDEIIKQCQQSQFGKLRFTLCFNEPIGWSFTIPKEKFEKQFSVREDCLTYRLSQDASFKMICRTSTSLAPLTNKITFICRTKKTPAGVEVFIDQFYPGEDDNNVYINVSSHPIYPHIDHKSISGDMTKRTGLLWFQRRHKGEYPNSPIWK